MDTPLPARDVAAPHDRSNTTAVRVALGDGSLRVTVLPHGSNPQAVTASRTAARMLRGLVAMNTKVALGLTDRA